MKEITRRTVNGENFHLIAGYVFRWAKTKKRRMKKEYKEGRWFSLEIKFRDYHGKKVISCNDRTEEVHIVETLRDQFKSYFDIENGQPDAKDNIQAHIELRSGPLNVLAGETTSKTENTLIVNIKKL